ncbi:MAG: CoA-binding protein, partial [Anaerolineae bacterium]|nr:CoA-binding protein [Anaerolineae bacterium]
IDGERSYASLADVPEPIDIVNIFRRSEYLPEVVDQAIAVGAKAIWAQLGVYNHTAGRKAESAGLITVMDACIKVEYNRLMR